MTSSIRNFTMQLSFLYQRHVANVILIFYLGLWKSLRICYLRVYTDSSFGQVKSVRTHRRQLFWSKYQTIRELNHTGHPTNVLPSGGAPVAGKLQTHFSFLFSPLRFTTIFYHHGGVYISTFASWISEICYIPEAWAINSATTMLLVVWCSILTVPLRFSLDVDRKSTRLNSSHLRRSRMPSSA